MKTHELVGLQEEAHAAYHQGDYSTTINVLERLIEVTVNAGMEENAAERHIMHIFAADVRKELFEFRAIDGLCVVFFCFSKISPWDPDSRELRAECYIRMGDPQKAIQDLTPTTRLRNDNRAAFLKLSMLHYTLGEHHESLRFAGTSKRSSSSAWGERPPSHLVHSSVPRSNIRECLKLDQDDKECFGHYKQVKKLSKQLDSAEELIESERSVLLVMFPEF